MSGLDPTTLSTTNLPDIAARHVEAWVRDLYAILQPAVDAFFVKMGRASTFYADGTGASLVLHADTIELLAAMSQADPTTGWPADYFSDEETRIGDRIMTDYTDQPTPLFDISS